jgi:ADP-ribosylglycohydrolase
MVTSRLRDRIRGALVGLATGDAVGTTVEFQPRGSFAPVTDMTGGGPFGLEPGQWTDDTSMALCLAESLVCTGRMDLGDQASRYVRWWRHGHLSSTGRCFDIGNATRAALLRYEQSGDPRAGSVDANAAGNGSLMRLAPVAMKFCACPAVAVHACGESSLVTHAAPACIDACRWFGGLLAGAMLGAAKEELLSPMYTPVPGLWERHPLLSPEVLAVARGSYLAKEPPAIRGSGWVVHTLEAALWAFARTTSFAAGLLQVVNLGEDADSTGAVYGQLAGAFYGESGIPDAWRSRLALWPTIDALASALVPGTMTQWSWESHGSREDGHQATA